MPDKKHLEGSDLVVIPLKKEAQELLKLLEERKISKISSIVRQVANKEDLEEIKKLGDEMNLDIPKELSITTEDNYEDYKQFLSTLS
ncbi:Uncharacterised protein [Legionella busanensis]|uniref:Uncharacterized protein n=1 Tax=Legionella busanensis TaxID=190655 RepID=A0A378JIY1_9GAMM|nr:hypothetical protein [Legionella busanensis]STX51114.1 Uncharacterised protein [Legionella busanensis]